MKGIRTAWAVLVPLLLLLALPAAAGAAPGAVSSPQAGGAEIDPYILFQLAKQGHANVFVKMASDADLSAAEGIVSRTDRLQFVYDSQIAQVAKAQADLWLFLRAKGFEFKPFWVNNSVYVYDADQALVEELAQRSDIAYLRGDRPVLLHTPVSESPAAQAAQSVEWNIGKINADDVWATGNTGQGIVIANIDTGVRYTHEAVVAQYRGNNGDGTFSHDYNWWDPDMSLAAPQDNVGHGTHTMGTMVGGDGAGPLTSDIGVAPGATWIAAQGCGTLFCSTFDLTSSAEWIACPTKVDGTEPDCSKAPHIVNNSWGGGGGDPWFNSFVKTWLSAGIAPVFSIGNDGPSCGTAGSPGDYKLVFAAGATDVNDVLGDFSSRGRGAFRPIKPDFSAPGVAVRSSVNGGDSAYAVYSGTSMAAPHVAGTVALMMSANPSATLLQIYDALRRTTVTALGAPPAPTSCAGRSYNVFPNEIYGWGRIDAAAAVARIAP